MLPSRIERYQGAMLGLAIGDALGTTLEFHIRDHFPPLTDMVGGGRFDVAPGYWTDDTAMALCLAESLVECGGFDAADQMRRYLRWFREGHNSSTGFCFDIGNTTTDALRRFEETGEPYSGDTHPGTAGNGSLMRLAPVALRYAHDPREAVLRAADSSRTTHATVEAVDACRLFALLIVGALNGVEKETLFSGAYAPSGVDWSAAPLAPKIREIANGAFARKGRDAINSSGYVVHTLEAALWAFYNTGSFREGALLAVNLGDDADTVGAVFGQLAGAYYGVHDIPTEWRERLVRHDEIAQLAARLVASRGR